MGIFTYIYHINWLAGFCPSTKTWNPGKAILLKLADFCKFLWVSCYFYPRLMNGKSRAREAMNAQNWKLLTNRTELYLIYAWIYTLYTYYSMYNYVRTLLYIVHTLCTV